MTRVIAPTDFSEPSRAGLIAAREHAAPLGAPVVLVHVWDRAALELHDPLLRSVAAENTSLVESIEAGLRDQLDVIVGELFEGLEVETKILHDRSPARAITGLAEPDDVIVIATHGRTGLTRFLIGSVAEKVVRLARCPVLVVPLPRAP
ncbi:MAG: universal stress protein [Sandaracinaceae bacterium]|nr:universal stress protein [Sandaracinaceae bacterium]